MRRSVRGIPRSRGWVVCGLLALACQDSEVAAKVRSLEARLAEGEVRQRKAEGRGAALEARVAALEEADEASVSCDTQGYAFAGTQLGKFMVSCEDLRPFADGYKLVLRIGNPHSATPQGVRLKVRYGARQPAAASEEAAGARQAAWKAALHETVVTLPDDLRPGTWNRVEVVLAGARAEDVGFLGVRMAVNRLSLH